MDLHLWAAFVAASLVMGLIPGPGVMSIVGYAIGSGRKTALASVAGLAAGNIIAMTLSMTGVGALLATSAVAFTVLKWAGALYLIALGVIAIAKKAPDDREPVAMPVIAPRTAFVSNVAVGTFHPKTIIFYIAFVPQFIDARAAYAPQAVILIMTFAAVVGLTDSAYALAASKLSHVLKTKRATLWSRRAGGGVLIAAGVATAATQR